jgi:hypothetical protein
MFQVTIPSNEEIPGAGAGAGSTAGGTAGAAVAPAVKHGVYRTTKLEDNLWHGKFARVFDSVHDNHDNGNQEGMRGAPSERD